MFERMLDKQYKPSYVQFVDYCGTCKSLYEEINSFLLNEIKAESLMRFPYGKSYGWGMKYFIKRKLICDIFAEKNAFTVMMRMTNKQFDSVYNELRDYTKEYIDNKYPCGEGGWIQYRVTNRQHLDDIKKLISVKTAVRF